VTEPDAALVFRDDTGMLWDELVNRLDRKLNHI
jgi:hypothetical protein